MPNKALTRDIVKHIAQRKTGADALEEFNEVLNATEGGLDWRDVDLTAILEHDFGVNWRQRIANEDRDVVENIITRSTFDRMIRPIIRRGLTENPKEAYKLSALVPGETAGECEDGFRDYGVFADPQVQEVGELEAGPLYGLTDDYMDHPRGRMIQNGVAWTQEALCRDPNRYLQSMIPKIADAHLQWKEDQLLDYAIGYKNSYNRSGTYYDTYYSDPALTGLFSSGGPWVNALGLDFACSQDLQTIRDTFYDMTDMVYGRPIDMDMSNLQVITSRQKADAMRPLLLSTAVENDVTCPGDGTTRKYIMTAEIANGMPAFDVTSYQRWVDRIVLRYGTQVTAAEAQNWFWIGRMNEFLGWVWQIAPRVTSCPLGSDECRRRIVALYKAESKGYAYVKDPYKGIMCVSDGSTET